MASVGVDVFAQARRLEGLAIGEEGDGAMRDAGRDCPDARRLCARLHEFWRRGGCEIDFLDAAPHQRVAHGAADNAGFLAVPIDGGEDAPQRRIVQQSFERNLIAHWIRPGTIWPFSTWAGI